MRYQFIAEQRGRDPLALLCRVMRVAPSGYYAWRRREPSKRQLANEELVQHIRAVHQTSRATYGSPRVHAELRDQGQTCGRNRVARLMRKHALGAKQPKRSTVTTHSQHTSPIAPNVLDRQFEAQAANRKWLADITYIDTLQGWLYLAVILDVFSRRIVGWAMADHVLSNLVEDALRMALLHRQPTDSLLHHSDRGSQYASHSYQKLLQDAHIQVSMSRRGDCYDNAMMESFFGTLKTECVTERYASRAAARGSLFDYIEIWYNRQRRHSALGYLSPVRFE